MAIFINYRRDDSKSVTDRIDEHLRNAFEGRSVYRDVDNIPLGVDFAKHIESELKKCDAFLVIIGKDWLIDRLNDENDFVRLEIEAALSRDIPVIPVLVNGGTLPKSDQLPATLRPLLRRQGITIMISLWLV